MPDLVARLLGAIQFLTIVPLRMSTAPPGRSALFFPLVGAMVGYAAGVLLANLPANVGPILTLIFLVGIGGGLHEDALADVFDALRAWRPRHVMLDILKDSRIGAHGALALLLVTLFRWQALASLRVDPIPALVVSQALPRAALVALAWVSRPVPGGSGAYLNATLTSTSAILAILQGLALSALLPWRVAVLSVAGSILLLRLFYLWFHARLGGINGDCLGTTALLLECYVLLVCATINF
jgi:adenosylcobinamide-GDP ribazoletransferase